VVTLAVELSLKAIIYLISYINHNKKQYATTTNLPRTSKKSWSDGNNAAELQG
jgi:hypothetical protein